MKLYDIFGTIRQPDPQAPSPLGEGWDGGRIIKGVEKK